MQIVTLDFETYFGDDYTLSKMTTEAYVRDPRFKAHCVGWKNANGFGSVYTDGWPENFILHKTAVVCHHAAFDGLILSHHYGIKPAFWFDTMSMARLLWPHAKSHSLGSLAKMFGLAEKTVPYNLFRGVRDLPPDIYQLVADGCAHDVELTYQLAQKMIPYVPKSELKLIDLTIRMFTEPALRLDRDLLTAYLRTTAEAKDDMLNECGVTRDDLNSADKFAAILRSLGVEPAMKPSKAKSKQGELTYAFAKTDLFMKSLLDDEDDRVANLAAARLGIKSNSVETRAQRMLDMDSRGPMCVYLAYAKAHTLRWAGGDSMNWQNFKRGSALRKSLRAPEGYAVLVIDASQIEARFLNWFYGQHDMLDKFRRKEDIYSEIATRFYGRPITKSAETEAERGMGKQIVLSCGYRAGADSIKNTARIGTYGPPVILTDDEAKAAKQLYRETHPQIKKGWEHCDNVILPALLAGDKDFAWGPLRVSGHNLWFPGDVRMDYSNLIGGFNAWGKPKFGRMTRKGEVNMHGGILTQNIMELLARQVMAGSMLQIAERYKVVTCTHDEIVYLAPLAEAQAAYEYGITLLSTAPAWCPDMPLAAEGGWDVNYSK